MMKRLVRQTAMAAVAAASFLPFLLAIQPAGAASVPDDAGLDSLSGAYLAARNADLEKDYANAATYYQLALKAAPDNVYFLERALVLTAAMGDVEQALEFARQLKAQADNSHPARLVLAVEAIRTGNYAQALDLLSGSAAGTKVGAVADLTSALVVAWARSGQGEIDKSVAELGKLKGESWYNAYKLLHAGYIEAASGRVQDAVKDFAAARELDPDAVRVAEAYARALALAGRTQEAIGALQDFLTRFPDNPLAKAALDDIRAGRNRADWVATPAEGVAEALAGIGTAVGQQGGIEVALFYLRLSLYLEPHSAGGLASYSLGNLLDASEQGEAAIGVLQGIEPNAPFRSLGMLRAALALDRMDRIDEAERAFQEAIRRNPDDVQAYISYGNMLRGRERFAEAADTYSKAIEKIGTTDKGDWTLFYFRGISNERVHEWEKAEADFRKGLELSPDQPLILNYLGYSWVDMGKNLDQALGMIRKAVELRPNDGYIVDSLGWAYYRLNRYDEAVSELEHAVSLKPDDPVIHDHLGDAYWKAARKLEAQFQWRHSRDLGAKAPDLDLILKKIAEGHLIEPSKGAALPSQPNSGAAASAAKMGGGAGVAASTAAQP